jgi:hypothetical protein
MRASGYVEFYAIMCNLVLCRLPFSFINKDVAKATCLCMLEEASHSLMVTVDAGIENADANFFFFFLILQNGKSSVEAEKAVMEEFGRCLTQIINSAQSGMEIFDFDDHLPFMCSPFYLFSL